jgi:hypothetical protein
MVMPFVAPLPHLPQVFLRHKVIKRSQTPDDLALFGPLAVTFERRHHGRPDGLGTRLLHDGFQKIVWKINGGLHDSNYR